MNGKEKIDLITNAINGDKNSLIKLIKEEQKNIYSTLFYLKKDESDIQDLMQNILIKLTSKIKNLKNPLSYKSWLNQIILNTYYDYLRKNKKRNGVVALLDEDDKIFNQIPDETFNPQTSLLNSELDNIIKKSIKNLPEHYKIPITLREIQGLSYDEISNITNTSIGTVKSRIARARTMIQDEIKKYSRG